MIKVFQHFGVIRHSLTAKVVLWTVSTVLVVFLCYFNMALYVTEKDVTTSANDKVHMQLNIAISSLDKELNGVEDAASKAASYINARGSSSDKDINVILESILLPNSFIQGVAIAFEPGALPSHPNGYVPYIMKNNDKYIVHDLAKTQDYTQKDWYHTAVTQKKGVWNEVFRETNGTIIICYSYPFYRPDGKLMGVFVFDINVHELGRTISAIKPFPNSTQLLLDRNRTFLVHPNSDYVMSKKIEDVISETDIHTNDILLNIKKRLSGKSSFVRDGKDILFFHAPTHHADLTLAIELYTDEVMAPVEDIRRQMILLTVLGVMVLAGACIMVLRRQLRPIVQFTRVAKSIAGGNFNTVIPQSKHHDELQQLGQALDHMQNSLIEYVDDLSTALHENDKIENELHIASEIQKSMLPKHYPPYPERDDIDIFGSLIAAREVSGDLYDFFIHDEKLYFCIGDVSGKGVPASLVMAVTRSIVRMISLREGSPHFTMSVINDAVADMNDSNMFVTMFIGVLDLATGHLIYCNGGHNAPLIIRGDTNSVEQLNVLPNLPVGIMEEMQYEPQETVLHANDSIFLYTDGLTEAENASHQLFGERAMMDIIKANSHCDAHEIVEEMMAKVRAHADGAEQNDDLTMLCVHYLGRQDKLKYVKTLQLSNNIHDLQRLEAYVQEVGNALHLDDEEVRNVNLALEEVVVNIMSYAYPEATIGTIHISTSATSSCIKTVIIDSGTPFDPCQLEFPDITLEAEEREIGGLGIFLVRNIMDSVDYAYVGGRNILTLRKRINNSDNTPEQV